MQCKKDILPRNIIQLVPYKNVSLPAAKRFPALFFLYLGKKQNHRKRPKVPLRKQQVTSHNIQNNPACHLV